MRCVLVGDRDLESWKVTAAVAVQSDRFLTHGLLDADVLWNAWAGKLGTMDKAVFVYRMMLRFNLFHVMRGRDALSRGLPDETLSRVEHVAMRRWRAGWGRGLVDGGGACGRRQRARATGDVHPPSLMGAVRTMRAAAVIATVVVAAAAALESIRSGRR